MNWIDDTPESKSLASFNFVDVRHKDIIKYSAFTNYKEYRPVASVSHVIHRGQKGFMASLVTLGYQKNGSVKTTYNESKLDLDKIVCEWIQKINLSREQNNAS